MLGSGVGGGVSVGGGIEGGGVSVGGGIEGGGVSDGDGTAVGVGPGVWDGVTDFVAAETWFE
jgi:hypothetical protein